MYPYLEGPSPNVLQIVSRRESHMLDDNYNTRILSLDTRHLGLKTHVSSGAINDATISNTEHLWDAYRPLVFNKTKKVNSSSELVVVV